MRDGEPVNNFDVTRKLEVNQRVEFDIASGEYQGEYSTQIADVKNEEQFIINAPFAKGSPIPITVNTRGDIKLREENGVYILPIQVVDRSFDSTQLLIVKLRGKVHKIQERRFFRLDLHERTEYRIMADNREEFEARVDTLHQPGGNTEVTIKPDKELPKLNTPGIIKDISAGGVKLSTEEKIKAEQVLEISFASFDVSFNSLFGEVIRTNQVVTEDIKRLEAGTKFINCNQQQRDELTRWIFAKQRELRKKGLL